MSEAAGSEASAALRRGLVAIVLAFATLAALLLSGVRAPEPADRGTSAEQDASRDRARAIPRKKALVYPLARLVPSDALAFASVPDLPDFFGELGRTGLASLFEDPETGPFLRQLRGEFLRSPWSERNVDLVSMLQVLKLSLVGKGGGSTGETGVCTGEAAVALLGLDPETGRLEVLFLADVAGREARVRALVGAPETYASLHGLAKRRAVGEATVTSIELPERRGRAEKRRELCAWSVHGGLLVAGTSASAVEGALARAEIAAGGEVEGSLELDGSFKTSVARAALGGDPAAGHDYLVYVNIERALGGLFGERAGHVLARAGLEGLRSAALVGRIGEGEDASVREAAYFHLPAKRGALLDVLAGPPIALDTARLVPPRALVALFGPVRAVTDGRLQELVPALARLLDPVGGYMKHLDGEACVFLWSVGRINWLPRFGAMAGVAEGREGDAKSFAKAWAGLARALGGRVVERRVKAGVGGEPKTVVVRSIESMRYRLPGVRSLAGCVSGGKFVAATDAAAVPELVDLLSSLPAGRQAGKEKGLAWTDGMRRVLGELPRERRFFLYVNIPRIADRGFEPYGPAIIEALLPGSLRPAPPVPDVTPGALDRLDSRLDREAMPPGLAIGRRLGPAALSAMSDAEGVRIDAVTPAGLLPTIGFAALVADALWPATSSGQGRGPGAVEPRRPTEPTPPAEDEEVF